MKIFLTKSVFVIVLLSFVTTVMRLHVWNCFEISAEMEEVFKYSEEEKENSEKEISFDDTDLKSDLFVCDLSALLIECGRLHKLNQKLHLHYRNPLIEIIDSPPKLAV